MKITGSLPLNTEVGNAWEDLYPPGEPTNWIVGDWQKFIPNDSLRFMKRDQGTPASGASLAKHVSVKWFVHEPAHPAQWGQAKPPGAGRTLSILANGGKFQVTFWGADPEQKCIVTLDTPGDFAIWGDGVSHSWRPIETSSIITIRWEPLT
ncbi:hypothetical protein [Singulisphaera sp. PoT]|uniref:hypothetical protein n=1 Tax=Singulisphaera sp. PoT TaxID=3411797 RepID=UPI003BF540FB